MKTKTPPEIAAKRREKEAAFIKSTMRLLGVTQEQLAKMTGLNRPQIASYVRTKMHIHPPGWLILELIELRERHRSDERFSE